jgi:type II secretory pathway pseudopilin PulG
MLKTMFPIELLRTVLGLIGIGSAFMAGSTLSAVRKGQLKAGRHYAWMVRAAVCLAALAFRHNPDAIMIGSWALAAAAFAGGWWHASHQKPPEDLSHEIVPHDR